MPETTAQLEQTAKAETFRMADGLRWVVEKRGMMLVTPRGAVCTLIYPAAAVWDLMLRGYKFRKLVEMLRHIAGTSADDAERYVRTVLEEWTAAGFLERG